LLFQVCLPSQEAPALLWVIHQLTHLLVKLYLNLVLGPQRGGSQTLRCHFVFASLHIVLFWEGNFESEFTAKATFEFKEKLVERSGSPTKSSFILHQNRWLKGGSFKSRKGPISSLLIWLLVTVRDIQLEISW
jgi:hypothetical protein